MTHTKSIEEIIEEFAKWANNVIEHELEREWAKNWLRTTLTTILRQAYEDGLKAEATRRDGIERAIEHSIIDQRVMEAVAKERARIELEVIRTLPFYPDAQKCVLEIINEQ